MLTVILPPWIAHRGASRVAPENTLAALRQAKNLGARWIEFDVQLTQDEQPIIFHDARLERTSNGKGLVSRTPLETIQQLDAGHWFSKAFKGERIPTLAEYLTAAAELELGINIELKANKKHSEKLAEIVMSHLTQFWPSHLPRPLISSSNTACLAAIRDWEFKGYITDTWTDQWQELLKKYQCASLHIAYSELTPERIHAVKAAGYLLLAYTINDVAIANRLLTHGVDSVFTDTLNKIDLPMSDTVVSNVETQYLQHALALAKTMQGFTAPNPSVGAVIVKNNQVLSEGVHRGPNFPHAEAEAIQKISHAETQAASLYVTLEPCCHHGRTPPCTDLIIQSGIQTVYYGFLDPNPLVSGKGIKQLEAAGIICHHLPLPEIDYFYRGYRYWHLYHRPWVTAKLAISLDGKIAGPSGKPVTLSNKALSRYTHQNRKIYDAILTTSRTIIQDNPQLNVRLDDTLQKKSIYILDSELRIPVNAKIWETAKKITLFHAALSAHAREQKKILEKHAASQHLNLNFIEIPQNQNKKLDLKTVLSHIGQDGIHYLWIEAGGQCFESFLHQELLQEALIYITPHVLGSDATAAFSKPYAFLDSAKQLHYQTFSDNVLLYIDFFTPPC